MLTGVAMVGLTGSLSLMFLIIVPKSAKNLHKILLTTVLRAPLSYFATTDVGIILNQFSQDMELVDTALPEAW